MTVPSSIPLPSSKRTSSRHGSSSRARRDTRANTSGPIIGHTDLDARTAAEIEERRRASQPRPERRILADDASVAVRPSTGNGGRPDGSTRARGTSDSGKSFTQSSTSSLSHHQSTSSIDHADKLRAAGATDGQVYCRPRITSLGEFQLVDFSSNSNTIPSSSQQTTADRTLRPIGDGQREPDSQRGNSNRRRQPPNQPLGMGSGLGEPRPRQLNAITHSSPKNDLGTLEQMALKRMRQ